MQCNAYTAKLKMHFAPSFMQCNAYTAKLKMHFAPSFMPPGVGGWVQRNFTSDYL